MGDVRYQFVAVGADGVTGAFRSIERSALSSKAAVEAMFASLRSGSVGLSGRGLGLGAGAGGAANDVVGDIRRETRERESSLRHVAAIKERYFREEQSREDRQRRQYEQQEERAAARVAADRERTSLRSRVGEAGRAVGRMALSKAGAAAASGAVGLTIAAVREAYQLDEQAQRISINARKAGEDFIDPRKLRKEFQEAAASAPGIKATDVANAVQQFITVTGELDTARKSEKTFATVASASGSDVADVAQAAAALSMQMNIKGEGQMKEVMATLLAQGKSGSFELRDAAALFPRLAAAAGGFGVEKSAKGVATLGALTQIARSATGSGEQATTAVENIFVNLKTKSGKLKSSGVDVFNKDGTSRDIVDILTESVAKVGGKDLVKKQQGLQQIFGEQGGRAMNPLISAYIDTFTKKMKEGSKEQDAIAEATVAVRKKMTDFIDAAGDWKEVQKDAAKAQESASARVTAAWEKLISSASDKLAPSIAKMAEGLADSRFTDALAATVEGFGMLAEGASVIAKAVGIEGKKETPFETENRARKELAELEAAPAASTLEGARAQSAKIKRARLALSTATAMAWQKAPEDVKSFEDFDKRLGVGGLDDDARKSMYNNILMHPEAYRVSLEQDKYASAVGMGSGMDEGQRKAAEGLIEQVIAAQQSGGTKTLPTIDVEEANSALGQLTGAFLEARAALSQSIAGDLLGGNGAQ